MTSSSDVVRHKEQILGKQVLAGLNMEGGDGKGRYATIGHLHTYTRAFGDPEEREGIWLLKHDVTACFELDENFTQHAHELKLLAAMDRWAEFGD